MHALMKEIMYCTFSISYYYSYKSYITLEQTIYFISNKQSVYLIQGNRANNVLRQNFRHRKSMHPDSLYRLYSFIPSSLICFLHLRILHQSRYRLISQAKYNCKSHRDKLRVKGSQQRANSTCAEANTNDNNFESYYNNT